MFSEAWDRFKDLLRACPHHGFTELHQLDTFYNGLNPSDQDSLNSAAGGNLLERSAQDVLKIIENKSKVRNSRNKPIVSQVKASNVDSSEIASAVASAVTSAMTAMFKNIKVLHENDQCQPMNQDFYNSNLFGFDQFKPPQFLVNYPPQAKDLIETIQAFLKEYDHIPPNKKCMALLIAEERFLKIKQTMEEEHNQPEVMQELLLKLMNDLQILKGIQQEKKEMAAQSFTPYWNLLGITDLKITKPIRRNEERRNNEGPKELWCSYWLYILIRTGDYVLLLVISFLLVALYVPAGRLSGSYWSGYGFYCLPYSILFVIAAGIIGP
ncbi:hypothetical protein Tco_0311781 [Tanacetum coccineum]